MDINSRRELYEKIYYYELDQREKLESRLKIPMTIFAIEFSMALFLFNKIIVIKNFSPDEFFWVIYTGGCVSLIISIFFFIKSWYGYKYKLIPTSIDIENYYRDTKEHYYKIDTDKFESWTNEAFQEYLLESYRNYGAYNTINNDRKSYNLHNCISTLLISFILFAISYYPYYTFVHQQS